MINTLKKLKEKLYLEKCYYFDYPKLSTQFNFLVLTNDETIEKILAEKPSVSRFAEGELALMEIQIIGFQKGDEGLAKRLREISGLQDGLHYRYHDQKQRICSPNAAVSRRLCYKSF